MTYYFRNESLISNDHKAFCWKNESWYSMLPYEAITLEFQVMNKNDSEYEHIEKDSLFDGEDYEHVSQDPIVNTDYPIFVYSEFIDCYQRVICKTVSFTKELLVYLGFFSDKLHVTNKASWF